jgi:hypothetical protein
MDFTNKENWIKDYESGQTRECPFCSGENSEHSCRNCYLDIDKETCWKYKSFCQKCFIYINEEIPKIEALKEKLGIKCKCNDPDCGKCLIENCKDDDCPVHTMERKIKRRRNKNLK